MYVQQPTDYSGWLPIWLWHSVIWGVPRNTRGLLQGPGVTGLPKQNLHSTSHLDPDNKPDPLPNHKRDPDNKPHPVPNQKPDPHNSPNPVPNHNPDRNPNPSTDPNPHRNPNSSTDPNTDTNFEFSTNSNFNANRNRVPSTHLYTISIRLR